MACFLFSFYMCFLIYHHHVLSIFFHALLLSTQTTWPSDLLILEKVALVLQVIDVNFITMLYNMVQSACFGFLF